MSSPDQDGDFGVKSHRCDFVSDWLLRQAAHQAPPDLSERLAEEWRADMSSRPSYLSRLRFALGCCWATQVIASEHQPVTRLAGNAGGAQFAFGDAHNFNFYSGRGSSFAVVVAVHVAVFYALFTWVSGPHKPPETAALVPRIYPKPDVPAVEPPRPPNSVYVDWELPREPTAVPIPEDQDDRPAVPPTDNIVAGSAQQPALPPHQAQRIPGGTGAGFPNPDDYYPGREIRLGEQGAAVVNVCVDPKGKLYQLPAIATSSGHSGLDEAALKLARAGSGHYRPSTDDGQAVSACFPVKVRFQLKN